MSEAKTMVASVQLEVLICGGQDQYLSACQYNVYCMQNKFRRCFNVCLKD